MKVVHGTAIYTGGGQYTLIGELDNGLWFCGFNDYCAVTNFDTRTSVRDFYNDDGYNVDNNDLAIYHMDLTLEEGYVVDVDLKEKYEMFYNFCKRLDAGEPGLTDGYEKYSNYQPELCEYIDFSYFDEYPEGVVTKDGWRNMDDGNVEIYYAMVNVLDWWGKQSGKREKPIETMRVLTNLQKLSPDNTPQAVGDANDCGECKTWWDVMRGFTEAWKNGDRE